MIRGVIFDLDDTLYLEADYAKSGMDFIGRWASEELGVEGFAEELHRLWNENIRTKTFDIALKNIGIKLERAQIKEMVSQYRQHKPNIFLQDDARLVLDILKDDYVLGLITDGYEVAQRNKIEALKLHEWMSQIIVTDSLGPDCWKPSQIPYKLMEEKVNLDAFECVYIGDNVKKDFVTARARGWKTVQVNRAGKVHADPDQIGSSYKADITVNSLKGLPAILDHFNR